MKDKLILKALVCSAFMCSLSVGTMAADVSMDVKAGDTEQSSWMGSYGYRYWVTRYSERFLS